MATYLGFTRWAGGRPSDADLAEMRQSGALVPAALGQLVRQLLHAMPPGLRLITS